MCAIRRNRKVTLLYNIRKDTFCTPGLHGRAGYDNDKESGDYRRGGRRKRKIIFQKFFWIKMRGDANLELSFCSECNIKNKLNKGGYQWEFYLGSY